MAREVCEYSEGASGWMAARLLSKVDVLAELEKGFDRPANLRHPIICGWRRGLGVLGDSFQ